MPHRRFQPEPAVVVEIAVPFHRHHLGREFGECLANAVRAPVLFWCGACILWSITEDSGVVRYRDVQVQQETHKTLLTRTLDQARTISTAPDTPRRHLDGKRRHREYELAQ